MTSSLPLRPLNYGTSGFRSKADEQLNIIVYRAAFYAAIRAKKLGKAVGIMITASHNPACDNGLKLVDPNGRMLAMECEEELTKIANGTEQEFENFKNEEIKQINKEKDNLIPVIVIATDTRPSSFTLYKEAVKGIKLLGDSVEIKYFEHHTTPQLHYIFCDNKFKSSPLFLDCANGVGALWIKKYLENNGFICKNGFDTNNNENLNENIILVNLFNINTNKGELLNNNCGADFVKINTSLPINFPLNLSNGTRCASFDGDADRLIYFYPNNEGINKNNISLLDGDHICAIFAKFINEQLNEANSVGQPISLNFGVVQTAYANGNSTQAAQKFDIGIYFEANGHGTVYFSDKFYKLIKEFEEKENIPRYIQLLSIFSKLVNEVDGDAIADLMTVEFLLCYFQWTIQDWEMNTYNNCPSFQIKIPVPNRNIFVTPKDNETQLIEPIGIQQKINKCVEQFKNARAFIRYFFKLII